MNYGETLAYWYLRLNGFFPLVNFVLHRHEEGVEYSADSDLLAIRPPQVYEVVGGHDADWDTTKFEEWGLSLQRETIGLIVEVKTGKRAYQFAEGVHRAFDADSLLSGVHRIGIWQQGDEAQRIATELARARLYRDPEGRGVIAKLLVADHFPRADHIPPCFTLSLKEADKFIVKRMATYIHEKMADRMFFPSDLIQYVIWRQANNHS